MLRKIKTKLTKDDLQQPTINVDDAFLSDAASGTTTGALLLPVDQKISESLSAPVVPKSNEWMLRGDPAAPAIKDLELRAQQEREEAMRQMAAAEAAALPIPQLGGALGGAIAAPTDQDVLPQTLAAAAPGDSTPLPALGATAYPWAATTGAAPQAQPDDIPTIWDAPAAQPLAQTAPQALPTMPGQPLTATYTYNLPPVPVTPAAAQTDGEVVIHIDHTALPVSPVATSDKPAAAPFISGDGGQSDSFASGAAVRIPHDSPMNSLPYEPNVQKKDAKGKSI